MQTPPDGPCLYRPSTDTCPKSCQNHAIAKALTKGIIRTAQDISGKVDPPPDVLRDVAEKRMQGGRRGLQFDPCVKGYT